MAKRLEKFGESQGRRTVINVVGGDVHIRFASLKETDLMEHLADMGLRMEDVRPVMERFGRYLVEEHIPHQFEVRGTPRPWAGLDQEYARRKAIRFPGMPILEATRRMKKGFSHEARPRSLRITNRVKAGQSAGSKPRWIYHQSGTSTMPARQVLQMRQIDYQKLREFASDHLEGNLQ